MTMEDRAPQVRLNPLVLVVLLPHPVAVPLVGGVAQHPPQQRTKHARECEKEQGLFEQSRSKDARDRETPDKARERNRKGPAKNRKGAKRLGKA